MSLNYVLLLNLINGTKDLKMKSKKYLYLHSDLFWFGTRSVRDTLHETQKQEWSSLLTKHSVLKLEAVAGHRRLFLCDGGRQ